MSVDKQDTCFSRKITRTFLPLLILALPLVQGCKSQERIAEIITIEGTVTVRGNVPFTAVILETPGQNYYVLKLTPEQRSRLMTPARKRVTGRLYVDNWNGRAFAHIEVGSIEDLDV